MNSSEIGKLIIKARKAAGYTQKQLADLLFVSDKAVSKWERGVCMPDSSLFNKIALLLDIDVECLIPSHGRLESSPWMGEIRVKDIEGTVAGKPIIFYLLSYFMLVGIKDIYIETENRDYIEKLKLEKYGLNISFHPFHQRKTIILYDRFFLFGSNLTKVFQSYMNYDKDVSLFLDGKKIPFLFVHSPSHSIKWHEERSEKKNLGRGMIGMPLNEEAEQIILIYEKNSGLMVADLDEISRNRGLI